MSKTIWVDKAHKYLENGLKRFKKYDRPKEGLEVDLVLYGPSGLLAFEVKRSSRVNEGDIDGLLAFIEDYPMARPYLFFGGTRAYSIKGIDVLPFDQGLKGLRHILLGAPNGG